MKHKKRGTQIVDVPLLYYNLNVTKFDLTINYLAKAVALFSRMTVTFT